MVQIIPNRHKSFSEQALEGVNAFTPALQQFLQQQQLQSQREVENQSLKQMGLHLSGISDPEMRHQAFSSRLQGENARKLEEFKNLGRADLLRQKQDFVNQLFGSQNNEGNVSGQSSQNTGINPGNLSDADIAQAAAIDPTLGRILQHQKDVALRERRAVEDKEFRERQFSEQQRKNSPEYVREQESVKSQAKADIDYNKKVQDSTKRTVLKRESLDRLKALNKKGVTGKPYEKILEKMGLIALTSEGRREFAAEVKNQFTDFKDIAGSQLTGGEFNTLVNAYPNPDFSQAANDSIIRNLEIVQDILNQEHKIANQIKKQNAGKAPFDFQSKVNERLEDYARERTGEMKENIHKILNEQYGVPAGNVLMFDSSGKELFVPESEIDEALSTGAQFP